MERYFKLFIVALLTTTSFALTSCGNDEPNGPDDGGNTIVINDVKYKISDYMTLSGSWSSTTDSGSFGFFIDIVEGNSIMPWPYDFEFESANAPKVGDDISKKNLKLSLISDYYTGLVDIEADYVSGSAVVKAINTSKGTMTIQFSNLKMEGSGLGSSTEEDVRYTFDGTVTVDFNM